jgi:hypothetical protein
VPLHSKIFMEFEIPFSMFPHHLRFFNGVEENNKVNNPGFWSTNVLSRCKNWFIGRTFSLQTNKVLPVATEMIVLKC